MKKYLFIFATAAIVVSCSDLDTFKKDIQTGNDEAINFTSFSQPATRAENSSATDKWTFFTHHANFQVWGYKNTEADAVFSEDIVTVAEAESPATGYTYTYAPTRYWDKAATSYQFYAAAPANAGWTFDGVSSIATQNEGYFKTTSTITGVNLMATTPAASMSESFKGKADVDKLIAEPCEIKKAKFAIEPVQLNFIHILSKLNVTIKKDTKLASQTVTLKSFEVMNLFNKGDFDENTSVSNLASGSNGRWTKASDATSVKYESKKDWEITTAANYIIESLVIPQDAAVEVVALDGQAHAAVDAVNYASLQEYNTAHPSAELTAAQWAVLTGANPSRTDYNEATEGTDNDINSDEEFEALLATLIKEPAIAAINAVSTTSEPYLKIVYTIKDGNNTAEQFTAYYNLATAFKGSATQASTLGFYEGWQNTLNINISPAEIEFCADIYQWADKSADMTVW